MKILDNLRMRDLYFANPQALVLQQLTRCFGGQLTAVELAVVHVELATLDPGHGPRVQSDSFTRTAKIGEVLVDKEGAVVVVETAFATNEEFDVFDPRWVVDQLFERLAGFVDLLKVEAFFFAGKALAEVFFFFDGLAALLFFLVAVGLEDGFVLPFLMTVFFFEAVFAFRGFLVEVFRTGFFWAMQYPFYIISKNF